ncbi:hypothetical protein [Kitasatospora sp. NPDC051914]|uniref:hypothetical protein n=1 Tax=Kitasatospora sp. NPDC051914 TaxID=3154945 RepID=UPI003438EB11
MTEAVHPAAPAAPAEPVFPGADGTPAWSGASAGEEFVAARQGFVPGDTPAAAVAGESLAARQGFVPGDIPAAAVAGESLAARRGSASTGDPFATVMGDRSAAAGVAADGAVPGVRAAVGQAPDGGPVSGAAAAAAASTEGAAPGTLRAAAGNAVTPGAEGALRGPDGALSALRGGTESAARSGSPGVVAAGGFVAIPEQYRAAAGPVLGVADQLRELSTGLSAYMLGMHDNAPWGNDDSGKKFANGEDGEPGYRANARDVIEGLKALPQVVETIGKRLKGLADSYEDSEQFSLSGFGEPELPAPAPGPIGSVYRDIASGRTTNPGRH